MTCISGFDLDDLDPAESRLVPDELAELEETPERDHPVQVLVGNPESIPDSFQVLERDRRTPAFPGLRNDGLRYDVVEIAGSAGFLAGETLENSFRVPGPVALEARSNTPAILPVLPDQLPVILGSSRSGRDIADPQIDSKDFVPGFLLDFRFDLDVDKKTPLRVDESRGTDLSALEHFSLIVSDVELELEPSDMARDGDYLVFELQSKCPLVERYESRLELELALAMGGLERSAGSAERGDYQIGGKFVLLPEIPVELVMKPDRVRHQMIATILGDLGSGLSVLLEEFLDGFEVAFLGY